MVKNTFLTITVATSCGSMGGLISSHQGLLIEVLNVLRRHVTASGSLNSRHTSQQTHKHESRLPQSPPPPPVWPVNYKAPPSLHIYMNQGKSHHLSPGLIICKSLI